MGVVVTMEVRSNVRGSDARHVSGTSLTTAGTNMCSLGFMTFEWTSDFSTVGCTRAVVFAKLIGAHCSLWGSQQDTLNLGTL